jgi:hypothetical protein
MFAQTVLGGVGMPVQIFDVFDIAKAHKDAGELRGRTTALDTNHMRTVVLCYKTPRCKNFVFSHLLLR